MRIGMILDAEFPPDPRVENEALSLVNAGFEVFLFCLTYSGQNDENYQGIEVKRYSSTKLNYKLSALAYTIPLYTIRMRKKIQHFIRKNRIDVLHIHDIRIAAAAFQANVSFNLPVVLDLHDNYPEVMQFYPHLQKFPGKYIISRKKWKEKESEFIQKALKVITVSPEFVEDLKKRFPNMEGKFSLVPNTIRKAFYSNFTIEPEVISRFKSHFVLLYLGDTHVRRGLETAIRSLPLLITKIPRVKLVIVGRNTTDYILKKLVADLNVETYVSFEGWQNMSLFQSYIEASEICISPLLRNKQHDIAYANKLFQYMSFGKPVLVSNAIAQRRLVQKTNSGLVHLENDEKDFANKVLELHANEELRKALGNRGKNFIENEFNWEETSKELINLYKNL